MGSIAVSGSFDNIRSRHIRFLEEASRLGPVHVYLWSDPLVKAITGVETRFSLAERQYFLYAVRYTNKVHTIDHLESRHALPHIEGVEPRIWAVTTEENSLHKQDFCGSHGINYQVIKEADLRGFPSQSIVYPTRSTRKKVVVTGCYDWLHSGHVRFFEETSQLGDLYVVVGHDENVRLLKGDGHPMFSEVERRYMVGAIKFVHQAMISSGSGWMDAEPEIETIKPDIYAVNADGDKPEKRSFCQQHGMEYVVLERTPAAGLPRRESTNLRGF